MGRVSVRIDSKSQSDIPVCNSSNKEYFPQLPESASGFCLTCASADSGSEPLVLMCYVGGNYQLYVVIYHIYNHIYSYA